MSFWIFCVTGPPRERSRRRSTFFILRAMEFKSFSFQVWMSRAIKAASVEALAQVGILDERDLRALAVFHRPVAQTPDRREAATSVPRFELAPLGELA